MDTNVGGTERRARVVVVAVAFLLMVGLSLSAMPAALAAATEASGTWGSVELPSPIRIVELEPSEVDSTGIPADASFRLVSHATELAASLAERLVVEPHIDLSVQPGADASIVELQPLQPLEPGSQLHFSLDDVDGARLGAWAFHVRTPVDVVSTVPRHHARKVPLNSGIELTFDRDGVIEPERSFSIEPPVQGRFQRRGRVLTFVPDKPLQPDTVYRVTLGAGVGTGDETTRTREDITVEFATRQVKAAKRARVRPPATFIQRIAEARPGEPAVVEAYVNKAKTQRVSVELYRFDSAAAVESALQGVRNQYEWPYREHAVDTAGMEQLDSQRATLRALDRWDRQRRALTLADPLPAGWYLLVIPPREGTGPGSQLILQVSDLSSYAHVTTTASLFWVNDLRTGKPVDGASVALVGGPVLGVTGPDGLLEVATPEALATYQPTPLVRVGTAEAAVYVPFVGGSWSGPNFEGWGRTAQPQDLAWTFLYSDRSAYRSTDTINVWGMIRDRTAGSVPDEVELRLRVDWDETDSEDPRPPDVARVTARPSADGVYSGSLGFEELPLGYYVVEVTDGDETIGETWVEVLHIVKPAYQLDVSTNRHAYLAGEGVRVAVSARFFDGTAVPGAPLTVRSRSQWRSATTNATGRTVARVKARADDWTQMTRQAIEARPKRAEEGEISGGTGIIVLPSSYYLDARVTRGGGEIRARGAVHAVDLAGLERQIETDIDADLDPRGAPVPGARVTARVIETEWVRRQDGTTYDFITKKVIPRYRYQAKRNRLPVQELVTGPDGSFGLTLPAVADRAYEVRFSTVDEAGRSARLDRYAWRPWPEEESTRPHLTIAAADDDENDEEDGTVPAFAEGERYSVELRQGTEPQPTGGRDRYLFLLQQAGLQDALVQRSPARTFTFEASHAPSVEVNVVRFTGSTYVAVPWGVTARLQPETRRLAIELVPDRDRYAPGETVDLALRTTRGEGEAAPASVVLRAVDEKLYAMGLAEDSAPLEALYQPVWSGVIRTYSTHLLPSGSTDGTDTGGSGDTASGGRSDFRDAVLFRQVETDADGEARVRFDVPDDLTSWRVSATAVSDRIEAGEATTLVPVGLPFFAEFVTARGFLVGDDARLRLRAYGSTLEADEPVTYTVSAPTLGLEATGIEGAAFKTVSVPLPSLEEGRHAITVDAVARAGTDDELHDRLTRSIDVRRSRLEHGRTEYLELSGARSVAGGAGLTTVVVTDAGRGRFIEDLVSLAWDDRPRADQALAAVQARRLLERTFGEASLDVPDASFDHEEFQARDGLIALLPYASSDEWLSMLVAIATPDAVDRTALLDGLRALDRRGKVSQERKLVAIVARAALGDEVLERLRAYLDDERLTTRERLLLGIGLASAGDERAALMLERDLLVRHGQQLGSWIRLWDEEAAQAAETGTSGTDGRKAPRRSPGLETSAELTALLSILAAAVGDDDVAAAADAYVAENPPDETLANLQRIAYISRLIERTSSSPASFVWQLGEEGGRVDLGPGESHQMVLTGPQRETMTLEPVSGAPVVASSWREPLDRAALAQDEGITIERVVSPEGTIRSADVVTVTLSVDLGPAAVNGCYLVTESAPSGIVPLREGTSWRRKDRDAGGSRRGQTPWSVEGQRVSWCVWADAKRPVQTLRYEARVVNNGSFLWEPALVQSTRAPQLARLSTADTLVIGSRPARSEADPSD